MNPSETTSDQEFIAAPATVSLGQWLVGVRQAQGLSAQDVATRTNRNLKQIQSIEADDYSSVSSPILLRAIVRHYAKTVGADENQAVAYLPEAYQQETASTQLREVDLDKVFASGGTPLKSPWISRSALVLLALAVLGLLAYWIFGARFMAKNEGAQKMSNPNQVQVVAPPPAPVAVVAPTDPAVVVATPSSTATTSTPTVMTAVTPAPIVVAPPPAAVADELVLKFKTNSWVEIKDADGKLLLSGEQLENTEQIVSGTLPLKVKIGNATNVETTWKGAAYDLTPSIKGGVARLNLE